MSVKCLLRHSVWLSIMEVYIVRCITVCVWSDRRPHTEMFAD